PLLPSRGFFLLHFFSDAKRNEAKKSGKEGDFQFTDRYLSAPFCRRQATKWLGLLYYLAIGVDICLGILYN
ncbi:MAG: hypothetical protein Q4C01_05710, partial [Clostridia bacterium]|nr:hypothetical protein [Clostridia bacterium]